jgi:uroporphyrinogen decarboxylase
MVETGAAAISVDGPTNLARAVEVARGKAVVIGNVNTNLFFLGSKDEMEKEIQNCIDVGAPGSGFILASGCEVPGIAPPEKVQWFMDAAREFGRYKSSPLPFGKDLT